MLLHRQRLYTGLLFIAIALAFGIATLRHYPIGTAASMGPGYFPLLLSIVLALLGVAALAQGVRLRARVSAGMPQEQAGRQAWRPVVYVLLANVLFGGLLTGIPAWDVPAHGLIVSIYAVVFVASLAGREHRHRHRQALVLATVLAVGCYAVFILAMGLTVPVWPSYLLT